jgi:cobalt-zinc-cadmium efflux system protein
VITWAALVVLLVWLLLVFGVRTVVQRRRTGDGGWRSPGGRRGTAQWWLRAILGFGAVGAALAAPVADLAGLPLLAPLDRTWLRWAGLVLAVVAVVASFAAQLAMGTSWRVGVDENERTTLVTTGPFAVVRNPVFTAGAGVLAGTALAVPNVIGLAGLAAVIVGLQVQVRRIEEPYLRRLHGDAYRTYAATTGRFLPWIGRLKEPGHEHGHAHGIGAHADRRWLILALVAIASFMVVEVVAGILAHSLALISDAAHMLTDAAAIGLALIAARLAARPAAGAYTYGLKRAEILSAQVNAVSLLLLAGWLTYEAVGRLWQPAPVAGWTVTLTAIAGLGVNLLAGWALRRANRTSLNVEGAYQHVLMDALASVAAIVAGAVVAATGFYQADPLATLFVVLLMVKAGWRLLRDSSRILLDAAPTGLDPDAVAHQLVDVDAVVEVHDLHLWQITAGQPALSAHVLVRPTADCHDVRGRLERLLASRYGISHATLQVDHAERHGTVAVGARHCEDPHGTTHRRDCIHA